MCVCLVRMAHFTILSRIKQACCWHSNDNTLCANIMLSVTIQKSKKVSSLCAKLCVRTQVNVIVGDVILGFSLQVV